MWSSWLKYGFLPSLLTSVVTDPDVFGYFKKKISDLWTSASGFISGTLADAEAGASAVRQLQSIHDQTLAKFFFDIKNGYGIAISLYRRKKISAAQMVTIALYFQTQEPGSQMFIPESRRKAYFPNTNPKDFSNPSLQISIQSLLVAECEVKNLVNVI